MLLWFEDRFVIGVYRKYGFGIHSFHLRNMLGDKQRGYAFYDISSFPFQNQYREISDVLFGSCKLQQITGSLFSWSETLSANHLFAY